MTSPTASRLSLEPKTIRVWREGYSLGDLRADFVAGLTVAVVALPLSMALAIASGATPAQGLITAIVAGFLISAFGGSRHQIGGPTGAFVVVVHGIIAAHGYDGLLLATLMAGVILLAAAATGLGNWIRYIPDPVVTGFTSGIAVTIASGQIADFAGIKGAGGADFLSKMMSLWAARGSLSLAALGLGVACLAGILVARRFAPRWPGFLMIVAGAAAAAVLLHLPVTTIGGRFGAMPAGLPMPALPVISLAKAQAVLPSALVIAFLAGIESLLSCMVADGMTGRRHRPNAELLAQGIANIGSALFGGLPATGAIARTATNIRAGARSPMAGMIHALAILLFMVLAAKVIVLAPLTALSAILFVVAWNMAEVHRFGALLRGPSGDRAILLTTFVLTVFSDLTVAITVGVVLSALRFMHRMAGAVDMNQVADDAPPSRPVPEGVEVFSFSGPLFFGAASRLDEFLAQAGVQPKAIVLRLEKTPYIDATGARLLASFIGRHTARGVPVILAGLAAAPARTLALSGAKADIEPSFDAALERLSRCPPAPSDSNSVAAT